MKLVLAKSCRCQNVCWLTCVAGSQLEPRLPSPFEPATSRRVGDLAKWIFQKFGIT